MLNYVAPTHLYLTVILALIYLYLATRFFRNKNLKSTTLDRVMAHVARYVLLIIYVSGIVMSISMGLMVSRLHHIISLIPAILMVGIRYMPLVTRKKNSSSMYAWMFAILFVLMIIIGLTSLPSRLPQF